MCLWNFVWCIMGDDCLATMWCRNCNQSMLVYFLSWRFCKWFCHFLGCFCFITALGVEPKQGLVPWNVGKLGVGGRWKENKRRAIPQKAPLLYLLFFSPNYISFLSFLLLSFYLFLCLFLLMSIVKVLGIVITSQQLPPSPTQKS